MNITARTLQPEAIYFGNNVKVNGKPQAEWNAEVSRNAVMQAVDLLRWVVLYTDRDKQATEVSCKVVTCFIKTKCLSLSSGDI